MIYWKWLLALAVVMVDWFCSEQARLDKVAMNTMFELIN
jgi:hypothetical protein